MRIPCVKHVVRAALLALLVVSTATAEAWSATWVGATNLSQSAPILQQDNVDIAIGTAGVVVAWAKGSPDYGMALSKKSDGTWTTSYVSPQVIGQMAWSPSVVYSGSQLSAVWAEGTSRGNCTTKHKVRQYDQGGGTRTILDNLYSPATAPDLAVGTSGGHLVFAAASSASDCTSSRVDLYYTYRPSLAQAWSAPVPIVTHNAVLAPGAVGGGVWYPRVATLGTKVYVVWEQLQQYATAVDSDVWYVVGTMQTGGPVWSAPVRLSPAEQQDAVRPNVAVGADGKVHVVWTNLVGSRSQPQAQYVYYRQFASSTVVPLNPAPIWVTGNFPTLAASSVSVSGQQVCVSWHGYTDAVGSGREEITTRCSLNGGASWQSPVNVSDSMTWLSIFPSTAIGSDGLLHFAWVEYQLVNNVTLPLAVFYRDSQEPDTQVFLPLVMRLR